MHGSRPSPCYIRGVRLEACGEGPRGASPGAPRRRDGVAATRPACGPRDRGASCRAALALALALALTGCFRDPGYDGQDVTGETAAASDASSSTAASTPDLPDETSETTGCETGDCATTTGTGEGVISPPSGGCVVPITHGSAQEAIDDPDCAEVYLMPGVHKGTLTISRDLTVRADCEGDVVLDGDGQGTTVTFRTRAGA